MANDKKTEETGIDQLNSTLTSAGEKLANNKKIIYWTVGAIVLVGVFIMGYFFIYKNPRTNAAWEAYDKVEQTAAGNDSIAAVEYKKVADKYGNTNAGNVAALDAGQSLYRLGKYEDAAKYLKKFDTSDEVLGANVLILTGDCLVNLKKYDEAIGYFKKGIKAANGNDQIVPRALLKMAAVYDEQKKYDQSLSCYEQIFADYPDFQPGSGMSIEAYIAREEARLGK